jgi:exodeoxyribonuclease V gamma subunit
MTGFFVHRNSRTEALAELLADAMQRELPTNPLSAQTIVVAHPGLGRWLLRRLADKHAIAANYRLLQPWQWMEQVAGAALGNASADDRAWRRQFLRWRILAELPSVDDALVKASLSGTDAQRRGFQLAERLSGLFTQYLLYRPDMIAGWEHDRQAGDWQAALWRRLRKTISAPHRAQRQQALCAALASKGDGVDEPLHVFGASHLPPDTLDAMVALSARRAVNLYFPDPCNQYWTDLKSKREILRNGEPPQEFYFEVGHPLLVSLGRMAQDFLLGLEDRGIDYSSDEDASEPETPDTLLGRVQSSVRACQPDRVESTCASRVDASLRVHACATRLREVEVLRDALLGFLAADSTLQPRDIVVMAPDIGTYAPYLPAVFGEPARYVDDPARIPWHLADVGLAVAHPLLRAFAHLLQLAESRFGLTEVLDFLDVPAIARRAGLRVDDRARLEDALRRAGVAWGLDADAKAQAGAAAVAANSWQFGFDRVFAGLIVGDESGAILLDGVLPFALPGADDAQSLGRLHAFVESLRRFASGLGKSRTLVAWCDWLEARIDALVEVDGNDAAESAALEALCGVLAELREQGDVCATPELPWSVVGEALRGALAAIPERQPFLLGGVTFCGLVPQRSIPFRVICLLGMNEGEFPRPGGDEGLNRMAQIPRRGDRDTRCEDRYLFLEAMMAARDRLHVSFTGHDVETGKPRNPAAPLAELMQFLDERYELSDEAKRPWRVDHALQAHAAQYFDGKDPALFSFAKPLAELASGLAVAPAFADWDKPHQVEAGQRLVSLDWLKRFWRDPAKMQMRDAGIDLGALDADDTLDVEPLRARTERRERIESALLFDALDAGIDELSPTAPAWLALSGRIANGAVGASAYANARELAQPALVAAREFLGKAVRRAPQAIDIACTSARLCGNVMEVFRGNDGQLRLFNAKIGGEANYTNLLPFYIDWACLRLGGIDASASFVEVDKDGARHDQPAMVPAILAQSDAQLRAGLENLLDLALSTQQQPVLFPPRTAWAWNAADAATRIGDAIKAWEGDGDYRTGERDYAPGYAALLLRDADWIGAATPAARLFEETCARIKDILDPRDANGADA